MLMKGGIYPNKQKYGAKWIARYPGGIWRRFNDYTDAENFLIALNFKAQEGTLDPRDYQRDMPLGFENLSSQWLAVKEAEGLRCLSNPRRHIRYAVKHFGNINIKSIEYGHLEDFFVWMRRTTDLSNKSLHDIRTTLRTFFRWVARRERGFTVPEFPEITYELNYRKTLSLEDQAAVIEEVRRISWAENPKIYLGILWLATYPVVRPVELVDVLEGDIDLANGLITVRHSKVRGQHKRIYLIPEDVETIRSMPRGLPHMPFFRHGPQKKGQPPGKRFGKDYFYTWWRRACTNLGIQGVPLYPGTKHSSVTNLGEFFTPEQIMGDGTEHRTNRAFARYFQVKADRRRAIGVHLRSAHKLQRKKEQAGEPNRKE